MEQTKEYLESIRNTDREVDEKIEVLKRMKQSMTSIQSSQMKEVNVMGGKNLTFEDKMSKYIDYSRELNENVDKLVDRKMEVFNKIDLLEEEEHRTLLVARYINGREWKDIAEMMGYDPKYIYEKLKKAIEEFHKVLT